MKKTAAVSIRAMFLITVAAGMAYLIFAAALLSFTFYQVRSYSANMTRLVNSLRAQELEYAAVAEDWQKLVNPATSRSSAEALERSVSEKSQMIRAKKKGILSEMKDDLEFPVEVYSILESIDSDYTSTYNRYRQTYERTKTGEANLEEIAALSGDAMGRMRASIDAASAQLEAKISLRAQIAGIESGDSYLKLSDNVLKELTAKAGNPSAALQQLKSAVVSGRSEISSLKSEASRSQNEQEAVSALRSSYGAISSMMTAFRSSLKSSDTAGSETDGNSSGKMNELVEKTRSIFEKRIAEWERIHLGVIIGTITLGLILLGSMPIFIRKRVLNPLVELQLVTARMSQGDLTGKLSASGHDEMGKFRRSILEMMESFKQLISKIREASNDANANAEKLAGHARSLNESASEQAASTEEASASIEQLTAAAEHVVGIISEQTESIERNMSITAAMLDSMERTHDSMNNLQQCAQSSAENSKKAEDAIEKATEAINQIKERSDRIGEIVKIITEISEQTNLLSLNASIEAARAGEHGKGFAVVAEEISKLAERTAESVSEIKKLVMESIESVNNGASEFSLAATSFAHITSQINDINESAHSVMKSVSEQSTMAQSIKETTSSVTQSASKVKNAAEEQKKATSEMNESIQMMSSLSQSIGARSDDLSLMVENLGKQALILKELIHTFKL